MIPQEHFGTADPVDVDWRDRLKDDLDLDDDEERPTSPDVIGMLGFDPADVDDDGDDLVKVKKSDKHSDKVQRQAQTVVKSK